MCGIVGVLGNHQAAPLLVEALKRLEYRGYDSAGIATVDHGRLDRRRSVGKLVHLSDLLVHDPLPGMIGIGHTRWATHGGPSVANAHPHRAGPVAVVHNGIIENYQALRSELGAAGLHFETETDSETVALLVQHYMQQGMEPVEATGAALRRLEGAFALALIFDGHDDLMIVARRGSPLAIGHGDGEVYVGSDAIALAPLTDRITYLDEGDWAVLSRARIEIRDAAGRRVHRSVQTVSIDLSQVEKGGYRHYMAKEIAEQPTVLGDALNHYLRDEGLVLPEPGLDFGGFDRITMVACGTAHYACLVAKYWFERIAGMTVEVDVASEFRYREPPVPPRTLALFVSQSARPPTPWPPCATARARRRGSSRSSTSRKARSPANPIWSCRSGPVPRSASPRPRPSPASWWCSTCWRSRPRRTAAGSTPTSSAAISSACAACRGC